MSTGIFSCITLSEGKTIQLELHLDKENSYLTLKDGDKTTEKFYLLGRDFHAPQNFIDDANIIHSNLISLSVDHLLARTLVSELIERIKRLRKS